jgi:oligopeptide transport system substrate-binding protein
MSFFCEINKSGNVGYMKSNITTFRKGAFMALLIFLLFGLVIWPGCFNSSASLENEKVFRMALRSEPPTLDLSLATDNVSFDVLTNIMEGLTQYNADLEPIPAIAERWEFSNDGRVITYFLRNDVFWTDGQPVTAMDFEYSWKRLLNPATGAEYAYFLFDIENAQEFNSGVIKDSDKVGVRALSPTTLRVKLKKPVIYFPSITTFMVTFPLRKDVIERFGDHWTDPENIVTNGPFRLAEWHHEYKLVLKANKDFYDGAPQIDRVLIFIVRESTTELTLYETGELDMVKLPPVAIPHYKSSPEFLQRPILRGYYYGFNVNKPPFDDVLVRRAFSHAIDRTQIPLILKGGEIPASSWIPKGMFGYNADIGPKFNPQLARDLLTQAGFSGGKELPPLNAVYNTDPTNKLIAEFVQAQWKEHLNVTVNIKSVEWMVFLNKLKVDTPQIFRLGWGADFPDPDNFMNLFTSTSGNNHMNWGNPGYDELISAGASEQNSVKRQAIYDQAQKILTELDTPIISLFGLTRNMLIKPYVENLEVNSMEIFYLKKIKINQPKHN